jgi:outer membrane receptor protein involved in Fe transport
LGFRGRLDKLDYSIALFHMNKENVIIQDSNRINISGAETSHKGIEIGASYKIADEWTLAASLTDARHTYEGNVNPGTVKLEGLEIDTAPKVMGNARLRWRHATYSAELEWVHMGAYFMDDANTARYPGHDLLNLRFHGDLTASWYYGINITNLLDRDYAERADYAFGVERYFVGEPRSVYVSTGYRF